MEDVGSGKAFQNCTFFILPLNIEEEGKLKGFLERHPSWRAAGDGEGFDLEYILRYASRMTLPGDGRLQVYRYSSGDKLPVYLKDAAAGLKSSSRRRTAGSVGDKSESIPMGDKAESSPAGDRAGCRPALGEISLYVFGCGIAFLEFQVVYGEMDPDAIVNFVKWFRSLRHNETSETYPEGSISLETAAERILPESETGTIRCFSNPSDLKRQANIYTILNPKGSRWKNKEKEAGGEAADPARLLAGYRDKLAHGYSGDNTLPDDGGDITAYKMHLDIPQKPEFWGGSQDGLVCISEKQWDRNLIMDYHFLYLLLLVQRCAAIRCLDRLSRYQMADNDELIKDVHKHVMDTKTRYLFRVISDEFFIQNIYSRMYDVLEVDQLFQDLEDINEQLRSIREEEQKKKEEGMETLLGIVSILAVFSALVDLASYLQMLPESWLPFSCSLVLVLTCLIFGIRHFPALTGWLLKMKKAKKTSAQSR